MNRRAAALVILVLLTATAIISYLHLIARCFLSPDDRAKEILIGLDVFSNAGMFGGSRWETISSHTGRAARHGDWWALYLNRFLNLLDPGHCERTNSAEQPVLDMLKKHGHL